MKNSPSITLLKTDHLLLHEIFERSVARWPNTVAVEAPPGAGQNERIQVTYAELDRKAEAMAALLEPYVKHECFVAILLPRDSDLLYAAQLAVLKAGAAYVCIDPRFPDERVRDILEDSGAVAALSDAAGCERLGKMLPGDANFLDVARAAHGERKRPGSLSPTSLAYVIYTSGTTGRPKGVLIEHRSIVNLVMSDLAEFELSPDDRVGQGSSAAYDSSVEEIWLAFASGATLVVMDDETARLGPDLIPWLQHERISVFCPPPTLLRATGCAEPETALPHLRLLYVGGEALPQDVADRWARGRRLVNGYGPTECTITCLRGDVVEGGPITIGKPVAGIFARVLDASGHELPAGQEGELCLGGIGLARGYWNSPQLTAEKFKEHPSLGRLYHTGDLAHCDDEGRYHYHGRMDSQVKIRGYRVELGEVESQLMHCKGVRAAACRVQEEGGSQTLVAFVVPGDFTSPPMAETLQSALEASLPSYMVPSRFGFLSELPTSVGGKLNRSALPWIEGAAVLADGPQLLPRNPMEASLERAVRGVLKFAEPISIDADFFKQLGGDSLRAAQLVTLLRKDPATAWVTVRDIYECRTVAALSMRTPLISASAEPSETRKKNRPLGRPFLTTLLQAVWLAVTLSASSWMVYLAGFRLLPWLTASLGLVPVLLALPLLGVLGFLIYTPLSLAFAVLVKRLLIGRYQAVRAPVWGSLYLRNWIVQNAVKFVPWHALEGTIFQQSALRALGAKIGQNVHIHRGVDLLSGGWDLLEIGDNATLCQDAALRLVELEDGEIVIGPITLGGGATLDIRSIVGGHSTIEANGYLTALSSLPPGGRIPCGERWDGIPARCAGRTPLPTTLTETSAVLSPVLHSLALIFARTALALAVSLPVQALTILLCLLQHWSADNIMEWFRQGDAAGTMGLALAIAVMGVPVTLAFEALIMRALGDVREGAINRWSLTYIKIWLKSGLVISAGKWLSGTLFWPLWLRWAGMKVGAGCEISTIIDVLPEHLEIGEETFLADGIYLGGPHIHRGVVTMKKTHLGRNTFLGNHSIIPAGQRLADDVLLGVCTVAQEGLMRQGTSWFGVPPFELPRREQVEMDRSLTHDPSGIRYANRVFWELLRFALPVLPLCVLYAWAHFLATSNIAMVPLITVGAVGFLLLFIVGLKWVLLGKVRPGQHALWSCWCSRWDFLYVAWGQYGSALSNLEGTLLLHWYLRAMGMQIGKRVVLGAGFAHVVDPDMLHIEDGATVNASYQAHTFEDRVLKLDHVYVSHGATLGSNCVPLYGADIGAEARVANHSVIMKGEHLIPGLSYEGSPCMPSLSGVAGGNQSSPPCVAEW